MLVVRSKSYLKPTVDLGAAANKLIYVQADSKICKQIHIEKLTNLQQINECKYANKVRNVRTY